MIVLGIILLIIGFVAKIAIVWTIGIVVLVLGLIAILLGSIGHGVGGRIHNGKPAGGRGAGRRGGGAPRPRTALSYMMTTNIETRCECRYLPP